MKESPFFQKDVRDGPNKPPLIAVAKIKISRWVSAVVLHDPLIDRKPVKIFENWSDMLIL